MTGHDILKEINRIDKEIDCLAKEGQRLGKKFVDDYIKSVQTIVVSKFINLIGRI